MDWLNEIFNKQKEFQKFLLNKNEITPDPVKVYNSATAAIVEICEMLQEDTRWKLAQGSVRPPHLDRNKFMMEYADVIIYLLNVLMYADISCDEIKEVISKKIYINWSRKS